MTAKSPAPKPDPRPLLLRHVQVATDFSDSAAEALERVAYLPLAERARVSVLHVLPVLGTKSARLGAEGVARTRIERTLAEFRKNMRRDVRVGFDIRSGPAFVEIVRQSRALGADLLVMGRHGVKPIRDMFIGSTAERVIRAGDVPVLVVGRKPRGAYRNPLVAVELEDTSRSVAVAAARLVDSQVVTAHLVHAYHVPFEGFITPSLSSGQSSALRREYKQAAASGLAKLSESLRELGLEWETTLIRGDPRAVILAEAIRRRADLLAIGTHGRSGLSHALLGSVAEWILRAAPCDLLVVKSTGVSFELP